MLEQLVESWQINHRVTLRLLEALSDDALKATLSTRGGRDVARQLAHVHEVRAGYAEVTSKTNRSAQLPHTKSASKEETNDDFEKTFAALVDSDRMRGGCAGANREATAEARRSHALSQCRRSAVRAGRKVGRLYRLNHRCEGRQGQLA